MHHFANITTHEAQHHDTIFNHSIDILPYRYALQIPALCLCRVCACTCMRVCVCGYVCVYIYAQVSSSLLEYVKIYHSRGTFHKHSSLAIFDVYLVRQINQGLPKVLPQYPLETALTMT